MTTKRAMIAVVCLLLAAAAYTQTKPALPGRTAMHLHLLQPSAEWNAYYDVAPDDQRALYWTAKCLLDNARQQTANVQALEKRIEALEAKLAATEPNVPDDPNEAKKP